MKPTIPLMAALSLMACAGAAHCAPAELAAAAAKVLRHVPASQPLLFGELHGTVQAPAFVAEVARAASESTPVLVGVEIATAEQERIDAFLASDGSTAAYRRLIDGPFWRDPQHDGRDSVAMAGLLESLRVLRAGGRDVHVLAFDCPRHGDGETRDSAMARCIDAGIVARPGARTVVLTGNYHARVGIGAPWDPNMEFTGYGLRKHDPVAIDVTASGGSAWVCTPECGPLELAKRATVEPLSVRFDAQRDARGYDGEVRFPAFEASPPARATLDGSAPAPAPAPAQPAAGA